MLLNTEKYFDHIISPPEILKYLAVDVVIVPTVSERETVINDFAAVTPDTQPTIITIQ